MSNQEPQVGTVPIMLSGPHSAPTTEFRGSSRETVELQRGPRTSIKDVKLDEDSYNRICTQVFALVDAQEKARQKDTRATAQHNGGFSVNEITVHLGLSASGKVAFIAEAGVEVSIEVTFKRGG
ncbi:Pepco domain-containing protein [Kitasatospora sp. NBC_01266]|uniref:Pepco domain-containing protein n=1 Tax=Kitasatospora sp. NBC_01266 TaxID=2903572 RepID=UPI002E34EC7E|nr:hypothetical protein [Kitasatospora sp. NBC_01266]